LNVPLFTWTLVAYGVGVETRPPETAGSADGAGAIGGLAPALVASGVESSSGRIELELELEPEPVDVERRR
jgi:hypothetical protein